MFLSGGPVPVSPVAIPVEPPIEAFGNDGFERSGNNSLHSKLWGIRPAEMEFEILRQALGATSVAE